MLKTDRQAKTTVRSGWKLRVQPPDFVSDGSSHSVNIIRRPHYAGEFGGAVLFQSNQKLGGTRPLSEPPPQPHRPKVVVGILPRRHVVHEGAEKASIASQPIAHPKFVPGGIVVPIGLPAG